MSNSNSTTAVADLNTSPFSFGLSPKNEAVLGQMVAKLLPSFDDEADMLRSPFTTPGYHTRLPLNVGDVHRTRDSLVFAVALLDTPQEANHSIAARIFRKMLALQDTDPESHTYGIWPWFLEEPLTEMSPPDWNWADFCGAQMLEALLTRRELLPEDLAADMDRAVVHAARSIERRDVNPDYTNITIMGAFVTLAAAESYGIADLHEYAMMRLRRFFDYTQEQQGAFTEYNSPYYTVIALNELLRLRRYARDPEAREMADTLYEFAWEEIAFHFHPPSGQWAGPYSRTYQTFLPAGVADLLHDVTGGRFPYSQKEPVLLDELHRMPHVCPARMVPCFLELKEPRTLRKPFLRGTPDLIGTTHFTRRYVLGTANYGEFWNQRRPLLAYWGNPDAPVCLRLRFLHDDYDFSAAQFFSVQNKGDVLAGITFATDAGDTHLCLDPIRDGTISAKDLRLRFEFTGLASEVVIASPATPGSPIHIAAGPVHVEFSVPAARWGSQEGRWECGGNGEIRWLDVVLYSGESRVFRFGDLKEAAMAVALGISETYMPAEPVSVIRTGGLYQIAWKDLRLSFPSSPDTMTRLRASFAEGVEHAR